MRGKATMAKITKVLAKYLMIILYFASANVWSMSDADILKGLETLGDWPAAYPLAQQLTRQQNTYQAWRDLAVKYAQFDTDKAAYLQTWQQASQLNQIAIYKDFITLSADSPLNLLAVQAIFKLVQAVDKVDIYLDFMENFPDSVEALQALLRVQELAFLRTQQLNRVEMYDAFVAAFPGAKQVVQAIEQAYQTEKHNIETDLNGKSLEEKEGLARRLFNEARIVEKEKPNNPQVARQYRLLLEIDDFKETAVVTELLDREERLAYQKLMLDQQTQITQSIERMQAAIVQAIQVQMKDLGNIITQQSKIQQQQFDELILAHQQMLVEMTQVTKAQFVYSGLDTAEKMTQVVPWLKNVAVTTEGAIKDTLHDEKCQMMGVVTGLAFGLTPVISLVKTPASIGATLVCESIPTIIQFIQKFF